MERNTMKTLSTKQIGSWDKAGRYTIDEPYKTASSDAIRRPSRAFPFSEYKHALTKKYAKQLSAKLGYEIQVVR